MVWRSFNTTGKTHHFQWMFTDHIWHKLRNCIIWFMVDASGTSVCKQCGGHLDYSTVSQFYFTARTLLALSGCTDTKIVRTIMHNKIQLTTNRRTEMNDRRRSRTRLKQQNCKHKLKQPKQSSCSTAIRTRQTWFNRR
jgi:hypothetical protein